MPCSLAITPLLDALLEERHVVFALVEQRAEDVLEEVLGELRVVGEVGERDLGLDHPELGEVPARVRVLGAERRAERVDLRERHAVGLDVELARHGQARLAPEEVLLEVDLAVGVRGRFARSSVETRNIWPAPSASDAVMIGVWIQKKPRSWKKRWTACASVWRTRVTAPITLVRGAQVRDLAQVLHRVALRLHRVGVGIVDPADDLDRARLHLERLALGLRRDDRAGRVDRAAGGQAQDLVRVVGELLGATTCTGSKPAVGDGTNDRPALESRRVRTQPLIVTGRLSARGRRGRRRR